MVRLNEAPPRGLAVILTIAALALCNLGLAVLIVAAMGISTFAPLWLGALCLVAGVCAAVGAVALWRGYLARLRHL